MAQKMRGGINDAAKAKAHAVIEAKRKVAKEENKLSAFQYCLSKIRKTKLDEHNWPKYSVEMKEWENVRMQGI